jgi:3-oxoacyl-[acyl-carrier-protein] synthase-1/3-oxoacyl-[acyl-carrier-protein] synthase II
VKPVAIIAIGAESALGSGRAAYSVGAVGQSARVAITPDEALRAAGLAKPFAARAAAGAAAGAADPAQALLRRAASQLLAELEHCLPAFRALRVAIAIGTSSGGMVSLTDALGRRARGEAVPRELARAAPYFGPLAELGALFGIVACESTQILAACASSGIAIGVGCRWLELGHADLVIAGGYDAVGTLVAAGFESIGATSASLPAPFGARRDGMALGEAAVLLALVPASARGTRSLGHIRGFGASCDAVHVTAPDRTGAGLAAAARAAMGDAKVDPDAIDLVSAHATATPFNDAAEALAVGALFGVRALDIAVHPFKAAVGHTLGASSALELAAVLDAMANGVLPGAAGLGVLDPGTPVRLLERNTAGSPRCCLKLSAAFGGANVAIVAGPDAGEGRPLARSGVECVAVGSPVVAADLAAVVDGLRLSRMAASRMDALSASAVAAAANALARAGTLPLERTGVVVGTIAATIENDEAFDRRLRERGAAFVEPRRFPPTSPNLPPGQCSIAFGLLGPSLSVGAGPEAPLEALLIAFDLLAAGDADAMVVVAAEHVGEVVRSLWAAAGWPVPTDGAAAVVLRRRAAGDCSRDRLSAWVSGVHAAGGVFSGARPGWPALLAAAEVLRGQNGVAPEG